MSVILTLAGLLVFGLAIRPRFLFDFRGDLYNAAQAILHGHNPYRVEYLYHLAWLKRHIGRVPPFAVPVYPAPVLLASVPFGLLPLWLGGGLFVAASIAGIVWGLRLFGVRDWRCIALVLLSWPCLFGLWLGTLSPLLVLGAAIVWRSRESAARCAGAIASLVLAKIFPWPLAFWPLLTRRWRTFALAVGMMAASSLAAWAVIGLHTLGTYPHVLSTLSYIERDAGVSLATTLIAFGVGPSLADLLALGCAGVLAAVAWRLARRGDEAGQRSAFGLLVIATLTASPLVWVHYEVLLFVPIALISPSLSPVWFLPLLSAFVPFPHFHNHLQMLMWPCLDGLVVIGLLRSARVGAPLRGASWLRLFGVRRGQYAESGS